MNVKNHKLENKWEGPNKVTKVHKVNVQVERVKGHAKVPRVKETWFHINMLKQYLEGN